MCDYAEFVHRMRNYAKTMPIEEAAEQTITECIQENILREFLIKNRAEAKRVSIYEYNEEEHMRMERADAFEDGFNKGLEDGFKKGRTEEQSNTERERLRADTAEAEIRRLKEQLESLKKKSLPLL